MRLNVVISTSQMYKGTVVTFTNTEHVALSHTCSLIQHQFYVCSCFHVFLFSAQPRPRLDSFSELELCIELRVNVVKNTNLKVSLHLHAVPVLSS